MKKVVFAFFIFGVLAFRLIEAPTQVASRGPASSDRLLVALAKPSKWFGAGTFVPAPARQKNPATEQAHLDASNYIPSDMAIDPELPSQQKGEIVVNRIADHSLTHYFNSPDFRKTSLGRTATDVEKKVKQEVVLKGASKDSIEHKFNFQVQAFQTLAKVEYIGFAQFSVSYNFRYETADMELAEKINARQSISLVHSRAPSESKSHVRMSWSF